MPFRVIDDGSYAGIEETDEEPDEYSVFDTFNAAKDALIKHLVNQREEYASAVRRARRLRRSDVVTEVNWNALTQKHLGRD